MVKKANNSFISATGIVKAFRITYQAVNHYTNLGLLDVISKDGNARMYQRAVVQKRLALITRLVREGYSLRLIRKKITGM